MRILGIDPGYDRIGVAVITEENRKEHVLFSSCIETNRKESFANRLLFLAQQIEVILETWKPDLLAIETLFFQNNKTTAMRVSEARGVIIYLATKAGLGIQEINPGTIKNTMTGNGRASKQEVIKMVQLTTGVRSAKHDDEYDAIAVGITGLHTSQSNHQEIK